MNVSQENTSKVSALIKIDIVKADYEEKVEKALRTYRQKANIPGFRKGMAPMGMIKKMVGKSILLEEINKLVSESLYNYIKDNKMNILGEPLPSESQAEIDFDKQEDFSFLFDVALAPEIDITLTDKDKIDYYHIDIDDDMVAKQKEALCSRFGGGHCSGETCIRRRAPQHAGKRRARVPPPHMDTVVAVWCGERKGRTSTMPPEPSMPATECIFVTSKASSKDMSGKIDNTDFANMVFPEPGGPISKMLCPPATAISIALFATT